MPGNQTENLRQHEANRKAHEAQQGNTNQEAAQALQGGAASRYLSRSAQRRLKKLQNQESKVSATPARHSYAPGLATKFVAGAAAFALMTAPMIAVAAPISRRNFGSSRRSKPVSRSQTVTSRYASSVTPGDSSFVLETEPARDVAPKAMQPKVSQPVESRAQKRSMEIQKWIQKGRVIPGATMREVEQQELFGYYVSIALSEVLETLASHNARGAALIDLAIQNDITLAAYDAAGGNTIVAENQHQVFFGPHPLPLDGQSRLLNGVITYPTLSPAESQRLSTINVPGQLLLGSVDDVADPVAAERELRTALYVFAAYQIPISADLAEFTTEISEWVDATWKKSGNPEEVTNALLLEPRIAAATAAQDLRIEAQQQMRLAMVLGQSATAPSLTTFLETHEVGQEFMQMVDDAIATVVEPDVAESVGRGGR